jgi:seryl-tRNA synthetase
MIDIEILRKRFTEAQENLELRGFDLDETKWNGMESLRKELQVKTESLQQQQNKLAGQIGEMQKKR